MQRWLLVAMASVAPILTAGSEDPHPALGALSMGGDLTGRVQARESAAAQRNSGGGGAPTSDLQPVVAPKLPTDVYLTLS